MARQMKDSGVEWIGMAPDNWNINLLSQLFLRVKTPNTGLCETNLLSLSYGKIKQRDIEAKGGLLPENFEGYNIIENNDIVLRLTDLQNDQTSLRVGHSTQRGIITSAYLTIRNKSKNSTRFLYYYLHTFDLCKGLYGMGAGIRQGLNWDGIKRLEFLLPPISEQHRIVNFLDTQCSKIDAVLAQTRSSIEEYKKLKQAVITQAVTKGVRGERAMKDSGIEWIGEIPAEWEFSRMKNEATIVDCKNRTPDIIPDGDYTVVRTTCIRNGKFSYEGSYKTDEKNYREWTERGEPRHGDVFFTREAPVGEACMVPNDPSLCMGQRVMYFRPKELVDGRYLMYSVYGSVTQEYIQSKNNGSTVGHLKLGQVGELPLLICNYTEQQEIADYLDEKCSAIDTLIAKKEQFLTELENYKKSLIYEYVTGKKEVANSHSIAVTMLDPIFMKALLYTKTYDQLGPKNRGRIQIQKIMYQGEYEAEIPLHSDYIRAKFGPMDKDFDAVEARIEYEGWLKINHSRHGTEYEKLAGYENFRILYEKHFTKYQDTIDRIISYYEGMKSSQVERFATLFAAWNDFIIDGKENPTEEELIAEVTTNWHPHKGNFKPETWQDTLKKMREAGIVPRGFGQHTEHYENRHKLAH